MYRYMVHTNRSTNRGWQGILVGVLHLKIYFFTGSERSSGIPCK